MLRFGGRVRDQLSLIKATWKQPFKCSVHSSYQRKSSKRLLAMSAPDSTPAPTHVPGQGIDRVRELLAQFSTDQAGGWDKAWSVNSSTVTHRISTLNLPHTHLPKFLYSFVITWPNLLNCAIAMFFLWRRVEKVTPWDRHGHPQPSLPELLESGEIDFPKTGTALVPGCGRVRSLYYLNWGFRDELIIGKQGYDTVCIATSLGIKAVGLDISATAVQKANEWVDSNTKVPLSS